MHKFKGIKGGSFKSSASLFKASVFVASAIVVERFLYRSANVFSIALS